MCKRKGSTWRKNSINLVRSKIENFNKYKVSSIGALELEKLQANILFICSRAYWNISLDLYISIIFVKISFWGVCIFYMFLQNILF